MMTQAELREPGDDGSRRFATGIASWTRRLVLGYFIAGLAWIVLGGTLVAGFRVPGHLATAVEIGKGIAFVALTTALLWWVCARMRRATIEAYDEAVASASAYQLLFESSPTGAFILDARDRRIVAVNDAALATFGWQRSEVLGADIERTGLFADPAALHAWEREVQDSTLPVHSSLQTCRHRLGRTLRVVMRCHSLRYRGQPALLVVTEDRNTELVALAEAEDARTMLESAERIAGVGSWRRHARGASGTWSPNTWALVGRPPLPGGAAPPLDEYMGWIHPEDRGAFAAAVEGLVQRGEPIDLRYRLIRGDGGEIVLHGLGERRSAGFIEGTIQDVTQRIAAERELGEHLALFRSLVGMLPVGVLILQDERVVFANQAASRQFGYADPESMTRTPLTDLLSSREIEGVRRQVDAAGPEPQFRMRQMRCADGSTFQAEMANMPVTFRGAPAVQLVVRDMSEQMHLWAELSEQHARLRHLSRRLLRVQEDERRQLARDLHDDIGQSLTAITLQAGLAAGATDEGARRACLDELVSQCQQCIDRLRDIASLLRPPQLDRLGIAAALRNAAGRILAAGGPVLDLQLDLPAQRPPQEVELACFRIAQECLTNVRRHAAARRVTIQLAAEDGALHLVVADDGKGFDARMTPDPASGSGLGLVGMRERAEAIGGELRIESRPGAGTRVQARLPFGAAPQAPTG